MRVSTSWTYQQSLNTMLAQEAALAATQNQVSTESRINVASDDPGGAGQAIGISHQLSNINQYTATINSANTRLSTESTTLNSITDLLNSARDLGLEAINGSLAPADRQSIATQLTQINQQILQLGNSKDSNGNALFAGTSNTDTPFVQAADGTVSYVGNDSQMMAAIGSGLQVATGDPGGELLMNNLNGNGSFVASAAAGNTGTGVVGTTSVTDPSTYKTDLAAAGGSYTINFDGAGNWSATDAGGNPVLDSSGNPVGGTYTDGDSISFNGMTIAMTGTPAAGDSVAVAKSSNQDIFSTLNNMITALQGNGTSAQLNNVLNRQIEALDSTQASVTSDVVQVGSRLDTLTQQGSTYSDLNVNYQASLSSVQDVDPATAISKLSLQSAALSASQQVFAKVADLSLFNYIK
jgi:flagellar hook-associated protein 3 FlgL